MVKTDNVLTMNLILPYPDDLDSQAYFLKEPVCVFVVHSLIADKTDIHPIDFTGPVTQISATHAIESMARNMIYPVRLSKIYIDVDGVSDATTREAAYALFLAKDESMRLYKYLIPVSAEEIEILYSGIYLAADGEVFHHPQKYRMKFVSTMPKSERNGFTSKSGVGIEIASPETLIVGGRKYGGRYRMERNNKIADRDSDPYRNDGGIETADQNGSEKLSEAVAHPMSGRTDGPAPGGEPTKDGESEEKSLP